MTLFDLKTYEGRQTFYQSKLWKDTRAYKIAKNPLCQECLKKNLLIPATQVHHTIDIAKLPTMENALDLNNLLSLCAPCHSKITTEEQYLKKFTPTPLKTQIFKF